MKSKLLYSIVAVLVVIVLFVLIDRDQNDGKTLIGVLTPISGPIAVAGETQKNALLLAAEKNTNDNDIELVFEDSKYDPMTSVSGYEALKLRGVKIIIADGSPVVAAIREKAVKDGIMIFAQSATTPAFTDDSSLTCRLGLTAELLAPGIIIKAKSLGYKSIGILTSNNEYGTVMKDEMLKAANKEGVNVELVEVYNQASSDLRSNVLKIIEKSDVLDALVVINNITPSSMFEQLKELGYKGKIISDTWTITSPNLTDKTVATGISFVDYAYSPQTDLNSNEKAKEYSEEYMARFKSSPILLGALTFDSYNILVSAVNKVGSDPHDLAKYFVGAPEYKGITGDVKFDSSCQNVNKKLVWRSVVSDGKFINQ